jgi:hypothetical protein
VGIERTQWQKPWFTWFTQVRAVRRVVRRVVQDSARQLTHTNGVAPMPDPTPNTQAERAAARAAFAARFSRPQGVDRREARAAELLASLHPGTLARARRRKRSAA